jgi:hypothetical protein
MRSALEDCIHLWLVKLCGQMQFELAVSYLLWQGWLPNLC